MKCDNGFHENYKSMCRYIGNKINPKGKLLNKKGSGYVTQNWAKPD